jgi:hypothetical protein
MRTQTEPKYCFFDACTLLDILAKDTPGIQSKFDKDRSTNLRKKTQNHVTASKLRGGILGVLRQGYTPQITNKNLNEAQSVFERYRKDISAQNKNDAMELFSLFVEFSTHHIPTEEFVETHDFIIQDIFKNKHKEPQKMLFEKHNKLTNNYNPFKFPEFNSKNTEGPLNARIWTDLETYIVAHKTKAAVFSSDDDFIHLSLSIKNLPIKEICYHENKLLASLLIPQTKLHHPKTHCGEPKTVRDLLNNLQQLKK